MGKHFVLVLASDMRRLGFMSLFERDFVLRWVMSITSAETLARSDRFDFAIVNFDPDPGRAIQFCESLKRIQPGIRIVFLKSPGMVLPKDFCADLVLDNAIGEAELARLMQDYLKRSA
ncbi:MAG: hypothetical protein JO065_16440 [Acidobacteria bacterium]|nr:hypothetical protein [Acidobacteriota bacterium]MBV9437183.1 hypothetical protein [Acidobacteriota bacterium]